jgi:hypothetical protein
VKAGLPTHVREGRAQLLTFKAQEFIENGSNRDKINGLGNFLLAPDIERDP